jgi:hypothetical protein
MARSSHDPPRNRSVMRFRGAQAFKSTPRSRRLSTFYPRCNKHSKNYQAWNNHSKSEVLSQQLGLPVGFLVGRRHPGRRRMSAAITRNHRLAGPQVEKAVAVAHASARGYTRPSPMPKLKELMSRSVENAHGCSPARTNRGWACDRISVKPDLDRTADRAGANTTTSAARPRPSPPSTGGVRERRCRRARSAPWRSRARYRQRRTPRDRLTGKSSALGAARPDARPLQRSPPGPV